MLLISMKEKQCDEMNKVEFDKQTSHFILNRDGIVTPYAYPPNSKNLWPNLRDEDFTVVLLSNPFLHKEIDCYEVEFNGSGERGGYILPIALLESEEAEGKPLLSYIFVAYRTLLQRLDEDKEATGVLSDSYKDAFVLIVHNQTIPSFNARDYLVSLASFGFYIYIGELKENYPELKFFEQLPKTLNLNINEVDNLNNEYVFDLLTNRICATSDFLTRFVLVYQVVEVYISEIHRKLLDSAIGNYKTGILNKNDFGEELKNISRESYQIEQLFTGFLEEPVSLEYKQSSLSLFEDVNYMIKNEKIPSLFYALRNQVFHNYKMFAGHEDALYQVIFCFERVVMMFLAKKKICEDE